MKKIRILVSLALSGTFNASMLILFLAALLLLSAVSFTCIASASMPEDADRSVEVITVNSSANSGSKEGSIAYEIQSPQDIKPIGDSKQIRVTCKFAKPFMGKRGEYDTVRIQSLRNFGKPGEPVLSFKTLHILLPQGKTVQSIEVTGNQVYVDGKYRIEHGQEPVPIGSKLTSKTLPNQTIYNSTNPFPGKLYTKASIQELRGYKILILNLYPVQYIPKKGKISYFDSVNVIVNTAPETIKGRTNFRESPQDKARVLDVVDNPEVVNTYNTQDVVTTGAQPTSIVDPADNYDYVIITNSALQSAFQPLADWKNTKGINTTIVTVDNIIADPNYDGNDTQEEIRNFIIDAYNNWGITYVLLGGDIEIIPKRDFRDPVSSQPWKIIPSDLYYAGLNGTWDDDDDSRYGEPGEEDLFAEVYVGRAPVNTVEDVSRFVAKTIAYEDDPPADYLKNTLMLAAKLDADTDGGIAKDKICNDTIPEEWNITKLYESDITASVSATTEQLNTGQHVVNNIGHANQYVIGLACTDYEAYYTISDVNGLVNAPKYFLFYTTGCDANAFDYVDCIGEHFVNNDNGAFAFIGNTRSGWYIPGYPGEGPSDKFDIEFFDELFINGTTNMGKTLQYSKENLAGDALEDSCMRYCYYTLNLLGDPETSLPTPDIWVDPTAFDVALPQGDVTNRTLTIGNNGTDVLKFNITESSTELAYDDGSAESAFAWSPEGSGSGGGWAVRFTPLYYPTKVTTARFHIWAGWPDIGHQAFQVQVLDDDGPDGAPGTLLATLNTSSNAGWVDVDLSSYNIVIDSGDFYIANIQLTNYPYCEGQSTDKSPPWDGRSWGYNGTEWTNLSSDHGDLMIRAVVELAEIDWLSANQTSGLVNTSNSTNITITFHATNLTVGTYNASIVIGSNDLDENPVIVPVHLTVLSFLPVHNLNIGLNYSTIQAAIEDVETLDGHTITVDPGTYNENVVVNKQLTIRSTSGNPADTIGQASNPNDHVFNISADYVNISGFTVKNATGTFKAGIYLGNGVEHCNITDNNVSSNGRGIFLSYSNNNTLNNNTALSNFDGIFLNASSNNTLEGNIVKVNNNNGIALNSSNYNIVLDNNLTNNTNGFYLNSSFNNSIYHNNIKNSTSLQAYDDGTNTWDNGYPSGGNHWSDWTSPDLYSGPNQDISGSDGIVDNPYLIPGGSNQDNYPSVNQSGWLIPVNIAPTIDAITISPDDDEVKDGIQVMPEPGGNKTVTITAVVSDPDGYADIDTVIANITGPGVVADSPVSLSFVSNTNATTATYNGTFNMSFYYANGTYTVNVTAIDKGGLTGSMLNPFEYLELIGLEIDTTAINFGLIDPGENSTVLGDADFTTQNNMTIKNMGNVILDMQLKGTNLTTDGNIIAVWNIYYDLLDNGYDSLNETLVEYDELDLSPSANAVHKANFRLHVPEGTFSGNYNGTLMMAAIHD
jgi:parallel beta-helix repeat protein